MTGRHLLPGLALVLVAAAYPAAATDPTVPTVLVFGLKNHVEDEAWRDLRLGMGIRGRLAQAVFDSGALLPLEEKDLAESVREAMGGYWLEERTGASATEALSVSGADWVAYGTLDRVGVTRDQVTGIVSGRRWKYRVQMTVCLASPSGFSICRSGNGSSETRVMGAIVEYRGDDVAFDQAGPAAAVERALVDAFNRLMPDWERRGAP